MNYTIIRNLAMAASLAITCTAPYAWSEKQRSGADYERAPTKAHHFAPGTSYTLCFVPDGPKCEVILIEAINGTQTSLLVQAYSFTSNPIAKAIENAKARGVDVRVIVDKSQISDRYSITTFLRNSGIPVAVDSRPAIAHNKVMIFDGEAVFTGSFNFTKSAQSRNAENGIILRGDSALAKAYFDNWLARFNQSMPY